MVDRPHLRRVCRRGRAPRTAGAVFAATSSLILAVGCPDALPYAATSSGASTGGSTGASTGISKGSSTGAPVGSSTGSSVGSSTGSSVGSSTGSSTSSSVGSSGGGCSPPCPGKCTAGRCFQAIHDGGSGVEGLAVDSTNVYFADQSEGGVGACPLDGCGTAGPTYYGTAPAWDVAVDATNVYWRDATGVYRAAISTPGVAPTQLAAGSFLGHLVGAVPTGIAVDATHVYWLSDDGMGNLAVLSCAKTGCGGTPMTVCSRSGGHATLAIDATHVYVGNYDNSEVFECPLAGGSVKSLAPALTLQAMTLHGTSLYWGNQDGTLDTCVAPACAPATILTSGNDYVGPLAADDQAVYFIDYPSHAGTGNLRKCALGGCDAGATMLVSDGIIQSVIVDSTSAYFGVGGRVVKVTPK